MSVGGGAMARELEAAAIDSVPAVLARAPSGSTCLRVIGALARMLGLFIGSPIGFAVALVGLVYIGLVEIGR